MAGYIRRRGTRSWEISAELPRDPLTGRRRRSQQSVKGTRRDAERELTALSRSIDTGAYVDPARETVAEFMARWLRDYATHSCAPSTQRRYAQSVNHHIVPALGVVPLGRLRTPHIVEAMAKWRATGVSEGTVLNTFRVLREALAHAGRWQVLGVNPADAVDRPRPRRPETRILSEGDLARLHASLGSDECGTALGLILGTGMRIGEALGLRWVDVDLTAGLAHVSQTLHKGGPAPVTGATKSHRSHRPVELGSDLTERLRRWRQAQTEARLFAGEAWHDLGYMVTDALGCPLPANRVRNALYRNLRDLGIPRVRVHDLRHSHASALLAAGENPRLVTERLGHARVGFTLETYGHLLPGQQGAAVERLNERMAARLKDAR